MKSPIVPSARALLLLVLAAPLAVVIAAVAPAGWVLMPVTALVLLALVLLDGWLAGPLRDWRLHAPDDGEVGREADVIVTAEIARRGGAAPPEAAIAFDPRLGAGGGLAFELEHAEAQGVWTGQAALLPTRRGAASLSGLWLRWTGPLGLAHRQAWRAIEKEVRIWPDLSSVRSPQLQTFLRDAQLGLVARRIRGDGTQFEALSEYEAGMDRRRIDWKASARHTNLYARENEAERDNQIVFAFDCSSAMCEPLDGLPRIDRAITAALTASYVALKGGDRVALFGFDAKPELMTPFVTDPRQFYRLQQAAAQLDYSDREPNFTLALATLAARLQRRSLIVLFSDFTDPTSAEIMVESVERLVRRHLVLFVTLEDAELTALTERTPERLADIAVAVTAAGLARQRALVLQRLRRLGVDVLEAPHDAITYSLIDRYFETKRTEAIG